MVIMDHHSPSISNPQSYYCRGINAIHWPKIASRTAAPWVVGVLGIIFPSARTCPAVHAVSDWSDMGKFYSSEQAEEAANPKPLASAAPSLIVSVFLLTVTVISI